jgi:hypothetical protein
MQPKMTKHESLLKTRVLWYYLATHPDYTSKLNAYNALKLQPDVNQCPLCEYASTKKDGYLKIDCRRCPLLHLWKRGCMTSGSPYAIWSEHSGTKQGAQAARRIVDAADKVLDEEFSND